MVAAMCGWSTADFVFFVDIAFSEILVAKSTVLAKPTGSLLLDLTKHTVSAKELGNL